MTFSGLVKKCASLTAISMFSYVSADSTIGIIGGNGAGPSSYAALVSSTGVATPISGLPATGVIESVALNIFTQGLIGGQSVNAAYAAIVSPAGVATSIAGLPITGIINDVALNDSNQGLIGGQNVAAAYAAMISSTGTATNISGLPVSGIINTVALNNANQGIIGGRQNVNQTYAAIISSTGTATTISGLPVTGIIFGTALNASNQAIIGGGMNVNQTYAALVSSSGTATTISGLPVTGLIFSVALNASNQAIIGGEMNGNQTYAATVSSSGTATTISGLPATGLIFGVALNASNQGIIGGRQNVNTPYAAMVSSTGITTVISGLPATGAIGSVAINDFNQGLIGGIDYAAIVSPSGIATSIPGLTGITINSVAILPLLTHIPTESLSHNNLDFANYINKYAPQDAFYFVPSLFDGTLTNALESAAPTRNAIALYTASNNLFYLNHALSNHLRNEYHFRNRAPSNRTSKVAANPNDLQPDELLASASDEIAWGNRSPNCKPKPPAPKKRPYTLWFDGIGALSYQKAQKQTVGFNPTTGAAILGFDAVVNDNGWIGGGASYSYTHIHENKRAGHSRINQEALFVYGSYQGSDFYFDGALWGGLFQITQVRNIHMTGFDFKSTSHPHGWQLDPHIELGYNAVHNNKLIVDPFVMADWVNAWQSSYREKGSGPFNAGQKAHHSSFLRTEVGVRLYETVSFDSWRLTFQEKASYLYKKPFGIGTVNAFLVGSPGSFTVETLTTPQNLGVGEFAMIFEPVDRQYPYGTIGYQGEFGSSSQSHQVTFELSWDF